MWKIILKKFSIYLLFLFKCFIFEQILNNNYKQVFAYAINGLKVLVS